METPTVWGLNNHTDYFERVEQMLITRAWILMTCHLSFLARYDDAIHYINPGYGAQAPKIVIL